MLQPPFFDSIRSVPIAIRERGMAWTYHVLQHIALWSTPTTVCGKSVEEKILGPSYSHSAVGGLESNEVRDDIQWSNNPAILYHGCSNNSGLIWESQGQRREEFQRAAFHELRAIAAGNGFIGKEEVMVARATTVYCIMRASLGTVLFPC